MGVTSAIVLYAVVWAMTFLIILPVRVKTQGDLGDIVPGTHAGAPEDHHLKRKAWISTGVAFVIWSILVVVITSGWVTIHDLDWFGRLDPPSAAHGTGG